MALNLRPPDTDSTIACSKQHDSWRAASRRCHHVLFVRPLLACSCKRHMQSVLTIQEAARCPTF